MLSPSQLPKIRDIEGFLFGLPFLGGMFGMFLELVKWLRDGWWDPATGWTVAHWFSRGGWLDAPESWFGLHKLVAGLLEVPLFISAPATAYALGWIVVSYVNHEVEK